MTVETETLILKAIEKLDQKLEKLDQKLDRFIETTNLKFENVQKELTDIKVNQAKTEANINAIAEIQKAQQSWLLSLMTGLVIGILGLVAAVGRVVFFKSV